MKIYDGELKQSFTSPYEQLFAHQLKDAGLEFQTQFKFEGPRQFRYDFYLPAIKAVVEVNGGIWQKSGHSTGRGISRDYEKLNYASGFGVLSFAFTPDMIESGEAIETIKSALDWQNRYKQLTKEQEQK